MSAPTRRSAEIATFTQRRASRRVGSSLCLGRLGRDKRIVRAKVNKVNVQLSRSMSIFRVHFRAVLRDSISSGVENKSEAGSPR